MVVDILDPVEEGKGHVVEDQPELALAIAGRPQLDLFGTG